MNNLKSIFKLIFVFLFMLSFSCMDVFANEVDGYQVVCGNNPPEEYKSISESCKTFICQEELNNRYAADIEIVGNNFKFTLKPADSSDENLMSAIFKLVDDNYNIKTHNGVAYIIKPNETIYIPKAAYNNSDDVVFNLKLDESTPPNVCTSEDLSKTLPNGKKLTSGLYISFSNEDYENHIPGNDYVTPTFPEVTNLGHVVDCSSGDPFDVAFCRVKNFTNDPSNPIKKIDYTGRFDNGAKHSTTETLKCDSKTIYKPSELIGDNYYKPENTTYLYGSGVYTMDSRELGSYVYHLYHPENNPKKVGLSCQIKCEEAVEVKYGTPIASKAGLCFEYKVQVTSRVSCVMTDAPDPPVKPNVCTPGPVCTGTNSNGNHYVVTEGGPNEEFDSCILNCDDGMYTPKCSQKCYNEVYKNSIELEYDSSKNNNVQYNNINYKEYCNNPDNITSIDIAKKCNEEIHHGYYYSSNGSSIKWKGKSGYAGRWYYVSGYPGNKNGDGCKGPYDAISGFCRRRKNDGSYCNDNCSWKKGCLQKDRYLNPYFAEADFKVNSDKYYAAVQKCQAAASCSTVPAEFTISVNYEDGSTNGITIDFPYSTGSDKLSTTSPNFETSFKNSEDFPKSTLLGYSGCYGNSANVNNLHFAEWGFPDSWINMKTGEISYKKLPNSNGWSNIKKKYCLPFDAGDVNIKWWNYYYDQIGHETCATTYNPIKYNIKAKTKEFGYFNWNIDIDCFYFYFFYFNFLFWTFK